MNKLFALILAIVMLFVGYIKTTHIPVEPTKPAISIVKPDGTGVLIKKKTINHRGLHTFLHKLGKMESKNNYEVVSSAGFLGRYQFHPRTIRAMGFKLSQKEFLNNPEIQDKVMLAFMRDNRRSLKPLIRKYDGKMVNGVRVTESGILAAAHLAGVGGVLSWFYPEKYQYKVVDANGASVAMYMKKFGGIQLGDI